MSNVLLNSKKTLLRQILSILVQIITITLIARELGVEDNGHYAMVLLLPIMLGTFLSLGLNSSTIFFVNKKNYPLNTIYTTTLIISMVIITVGMLFGYIIVTYFSQLLFPYQNIHMLMISLFIFPLLFLHSLHTSFIQAMENFNSYNISSLTNPILLMSFIILLYFLQNVTLQNVIISTIISLIISNLVSIYYVRKEGYRFKIFSFSSTFCKESLIYGLKSHISNIVAFVNYRTDIFLLNILSSPIAVGIYYIAVQIVERLWIITSAVNTVLFPRLVALEKENDQRLNLISKSFKMVILLTFLISLLLLIFGFYFIETFFGTEYTDAYYAILYLIPGIIIGAGSKVLANAIAAKGRPELNTYTSLFTMFINIFLNFILIPLYGFIGAAISTTIAYTINSILRIWLFKKLETDFSLHSFYITIKDFLYLKNKISIFNFKRV